MGAGAQTVSVWWLPGCISLYSLFCWCFDLRQELVEHQSSPAVQTGADTAWVENPVQNVHLQHLDWKQPGGFVGQSLLT